MRGSRREGRRPHPARARTASPRRRRKVPHSVTRASSQIASLESIRTTRSSPVSGSAIETFVGNEMKVPALAYSGSGVHSASRGVPAAVVEPIPRGSFVRTKSLGQGQTSSVENGEVGDVAHSGLRSPFESAQSGTPSPAFDQVTAVDPNARSSSELRPGWRYGAVSRLARDTPGNPPTLLR